MTIPRILALSLILAGPAMAGGSPAQRTKEQAARELMVLTGADKMGIQVLDQMIPSLKQAIPGADDSFWVEFRSSINPQDLVDLCIPAYAKHFTLEELEALIAFYKTPLGKKVIAAMPLVMSESMEAGRAWGQKLGATAWDKAQAAKAPPKKQD